MKNIFVGNLSFGTTEQDIRSLFEAHGSVDRVNIVTDRDTGQPRGFAFVEMTNDAEGDRAIDAVNGKEVGGRALNVNEARPKSEGGGGGGRGRGFGGGGGGGRGGSGGGGGRGRY
jgi:RNA recognition motif-containing protein